MFVIIFNVINRKGRKDRNAKGAKYLSELTLCLSVFAFNTEK